MFEFSSESMFSFALSCGFCEALLVAFWRAREADGSKALMIAPFSKILGDSIRELLFVSGTIFSPP